MYSNLQTYVIDRKPPLGAVRNPYLAINQGIVLDAMMSEGAGNTVQDLSGNGNTGTLVDNTHFVSGKFGPALEFDGSGDYVNVGNSSSINPTAAITVSAWVKADSFATYPTICARWRAAAGERGWSLVVGNDGVVTFSVRKSDDLGTVTSSGATLSTGVWYHVVGVFDGANVRVYTNAVSGTPAAYAGSILSTPNQDVRIGAYYTTSQPWDGLIDNVSLYNRFLSVSEIQQLYREPFCGYRWESIIELASYVAAGGETYIRTFDDGLGVSDAAGRTQVQVRIMSEAVGITDAITRTQVLARTIADNIGYDDGLAKLITYARTIADSLGITDAMSRVVGYPRTIDDGLGITDSVTATAAYARIVADAMGVVDDIARTQLQLRTIADSLGLTDVMAPGQQVIFADGVGTTDAMIRMQIQVRDLADSLGITDDLTRVANYIFTQSDDIGIADAMLRVAIALRTVSDNVGSTDTRSVSHVVAGAVKAAWAFMIVRQTKN